jgi:NADPH:quinone reductase-like Zn-dependent oxidoreductase
LSVISPYNQQLKSGDTFMSQRETMRAMFLIAHGGPEALLYRADIPVPKPGTFEVLIKVGAAGVNNTDINTRVGWYSKGDGDAKDASWGGQALSFPRIQGADICGEVIDIGAGADSELIGKRVLVEPCLRESNGEALVSPWYIGSECDGGFADYVTVAARHAYPIETTLSDAELASFPCSYSTAENMLTRAQVTENDTLLITGASGGVGSAAIQLAKARGARVIAMAGDKKQQSVLDAGADQALVRGDSLEAVLGENAVDVVIDVVGGAEWPELLNILRPFGRYAVSGAIAGPIVALDLRTLYLKDQQFMGCTVLDEGVFSRLVGLIERGEIKPLLARSFPLESLSQAQAFFLEKQFTGKLVIDMAL